MNRFDRASELEQIERDGCISKVTSALRPTEDQDCQRCGDEIGAARKRVCPEAVLCIRCARQAEQRQARR
jgi:RNA polymerase-binding transcription factor DksA